MKVSLIVSVMMAVGLFGCAPAKPKVICTMRNPNTGARVELYKEIPYKVPANYDEKRHIKEWKAEQIKKGFSVEVAK